jgi:hypothetical protein
MSLKNLSHPTVYHTTHEQVNGVYIDLPHDKTQKEAGSAMAEPYTYC